MEHVVVQTLLSSLEADAIAATTVPFDLVTSEFGDQHEDQHRIGEQEQGQWIVAAVAGVGRANFIVRQ
jgi:hypothetical protein